MTTNVIFSFSFPFFVATSENTGGGWEAIGRAPEKRALFHNSVDSFLKVR